MTKFDTCSFLLSGGTPVEVQRQFVFFLLPTHSPMDVSIATEALCEANAASLNAGVSQAYSWTIHTETGDAMTSRSGLSLAVDGGMDDFGLGTTIILCGGNRMEEKPSPALMQWLRKSSRHGVALGALGSGSTVLAQTGLLSNHKVASHWAVSTAMQETFPSIEVNNSVFDISQRSITCAGGIATLDMFLALVAQHQGNDCAQVTAASLVCSSIRDQHSEQTLSPSCRLGSQSEHLIDAIELMQQNIEHPMSPALIAEEVGVSCRQLERLFAKHLDTSPKAYSDKLRLEHARKLLQQTRMTILEVAMASGFNSTGHFAKLYRRRFGISPSGERGVPIQIAS